MKKKVYIALSVICFIYFLAIALSDGLDTSWLFVWPLLSIVFYAFAFQNEKSWLKKIPNWIFLSGKTGLILLSSMFIIFLGLSTWCVPEKPRNTFDYLIVLGGGVNDTEPSLALEKRLESAYEYLSSNTSTVAVVTGAQDKRNSISEAQCMWNWLTERGIDSSRIIIEDKAASTAENYEYSLKLIDVYSNGEKVNIGVVTNNFHVFRALCIGERIAAHDEQYNFYGVSADFPFYLYPHYIVREFCASTLYALRGDLKLPD